MFGNKKTTSNATNDDDLQLTTRSMKTDLEGESDAFVEEVSSPSKNISEPVGISEKKPGQKNNLQQSKTMDFPKKPAPIDKKNDDFKLPTDLPMAKNSTDIPPVTKKPIEDKNTKTHADDFFPEENNLKFPENPTKSEANKNLTEKPNKPEIKEEALDSTKTTPNKPSSTKAMTGKKDYDEFFKDKIKNLPKEENKTKKESSSNMILIIVLIIVLVIAIASGAYYYFFVIKKPVEQPIEPPIVEEDPVFPVEPVEPPVIEKYLPSILTEADSIMPTQEQSIKNILFDPQNPNNLSSGFYSIKNNEGEIISIQEVAMLLGIELPDTINSNSQKAWIYYDNSTTTPGISLVISIDQENSSEIEKSIADSEGTIFNNLSGLYTSPVNQYLTGEVIVFKDSSTNPGFRYYNLKTAPTSTSLDWGIVDDKLLVLATSQEMASTISSQLKSDDLLMNNEEGVEDDSQMPPVIDGNEITDTENQEISTENESEPINNPITQ